MTEWTTPTRRRVLITGGHGFLGRAVVQALVPAANAGELVLFTPTRQMYDLTDQDAVDACFRWALPEVVVHLACPYGGGGIGYAHAHPAELALGMTLMDSLLILATRKFKVRTFLGVGSVCAYPETVTFPTGEDQLWAGHPEAVNAPYGLAKRMQLTLLQAARKEWGLNGIHLILANLYGPGDRFGTELRGHVIPSTIVKMHQAVKAGADHVTAWGDGTPTREFLYIDDAARAIAQAVEYEGRDLAPGEPVNVVSGEEISIRNVVATIGMVMRYRGEIRWDPSKPGGQPRRWFSRSRALTTLNWQPQIWFDEGLRRTVAWYLAQEGGK